MSKTTPAVTGRCLCGGVRFEIRGWLSPIQCCHAERCRRATGAAFSPELVTSPAALHWVAGTDLIARYTAPLLREPPAYERAFCRVCGSPLPVPIEGSPFVLLQAGVLDGDPGVRPFRHAFTGQRAPWHDICDDLPRFAERPPLPEGALDLANGDDAP